MRGAGHQAGPFRLRPPDRYASSGPASPPAPRGKTKAWLRSTWTGTVAPGSGATFDTASNTLRNWLRNWSG